MIEYNCPHCNNLLKINQKYAGQSGQCKQCGKKITVPGAVTGIETSPPVFEVDDLDEELFQITGARQTYSERSGIQLTNSQKGCVGCITIFCMFIGACMVAIPSSGPPETKTTPPALPVQQVNHPVQPSPQPEPTPPPQSVQQEATQQVQPKEATVYLVKGRSIYHEWGCSSLNQGKHEILSGTISEAKQRGFNACKRCNPS